MNKSQSQEEPIIDFAYYVSTFYIFMDNSLKTFKNLKEAYTLFIELNFENNNKPNINEFERAKNAGTEEKLNKIKNIFEFGLNEINNKKIISIFEKANNLTTKISEMDKNFINLLTPYLFEYIEKIFNSIIKIMKNIEEKKTIDLLAFKLLQEECLEKEKEKKSFEALLKNHSEELKKINIKVDKLTIENENLLKNIKNMEEENVELKESVKKLEEENVELKECVKNLEEEKKNQSEEIEKIKQDLLFVKHLNLNLYIKEEDNQKKYDKYLKEISNLIENENKLNLENNKLKLENIKLKIDNAKKDSEIINLKVYLNNIIQLLTE